MIHQFDIASIMGGLYGDGIIGRKAGFERRWVQELAADFEILFEEARARPHGTLSRGPHRHYVEIHPEKLRGFVALVSHPWLTAVCEAVLGPEYKIVEFGFDVPGPGAVNQPWHRDFAAPPETVVGRRLSSLAFNITTVDVFEEMGPFEVALGTQWDDSREFVQGMFPPRSLYGRYEKRAERKLPKMGDISVRSALTIHRGTANFSGKSRPVLVVGAEALDATKAVQHNMQISRLVYETLPDSVCRHLTCSVVDDLQPIEQVHTIEGLLMGDSAPVQY